MKEYVFNGVGFKSKTDVDKHIRQVKNDYLEKERVGLIDRNHRLFNFFYELVMVHNDKEEKLGSGIQYFYFVVDSYGKDQLRIKHTDGGDIDCSYMFSRITKKYKDNRGFLNEALRNAIREQIFEYRGTLNHLQCIRCGDSKFCEIDHVKPFNKLRDDF